jgi:hypothetical protein
MTTRTIVSLSVPSDSEQFKMIMNAKQRGENVSKFILSCMACTSIEKERHISALRRKVKRLDEENDNLLAGIRKYRGMLGLNPLMDD